MLGVSGSSDYYTVMPGCVETPRLRNDRGFASNVSIGRQPVLGGPAQLHVHIIMDELIWLKNHIP